VSRFNGRLISAKNVSYQPRMRKHRVPARPPSLGLVQCSLVVPLFECWGVPWGLPSWGVKPVLPCVLWIGYWTKPSRRGSRPSDHRAARACFALPAPTVHAPPRPADPSLRLFHAPARPPQRWAVSTWSPHDRAQRARVRSSALRRHRAHVRAAPLPLPYPPRRSGASPLRTSPCPLPCRGADGPPILHCRARRARLHLACPASPRAALTAVAALLQIGGHRGHRVTARFCQSQARHEWPWR
jgi:hypothetical protein